MNAIFALIFALQVSLSNPAFVDEVAWRPVASGEEIEPDPSDGTYIDDIGYAIWTYETRSVDAEIVGASNGSYIDDIAYEIWTLATRTLD